MSFAAKHPISDNLVPHFAADGDNLLVQLVCDETHYLVPAIIFNGELPQHYVENYVFWYSPFAKAIELCPLANPWGFSSNNPKVTSNGERWCASKGNYLFLRREGAEFQQISEIFSPIERRSSITIAIHKTLNKFQICLPRFGLRFCLAVGSARIESLDHPGMYVDPCQDIGTLIGLQSKLVLRNDDADVERMVIIPECTLDVENQTKIYTRTGCNSHVTVVIDPNKFVRKHICRISTSQGRIHAEGDLQSKLFLCYLHATTSSCMSDPLSGCRGTDQALILLDDPTLNSMLALSEENRTLLILIANLSPKRTYYPINQKTMQTVIWDPDLSFLSQYDGFRPIVKRVFQGIKERSMIMTNEPVLVPETIRGSENDLIHHALIRNSYLRVDGTGAEAFSTAWDVDYYSKTPDTLLKAALRAYKVAKTINEKTETAFRRADSLNQSLMALFRERKTVFGGQKDFETALLRYDADLFLEPEGHLIRNWCSLHERVGQSGQSLNPYSLIMWLGTLTYSSGLHGHDHTRYSRRWLY
jgi:hypothetical protein